MYYSTYNCQRIPEGFSGAAVNSISLQEYPYGHSVGVMSALSHPIEALRKKHALCDGKTTNKVNSTVGIVFEKTTVAMVVPGGPASYQESGQQISKGDEVKKIDDQDVSAMTLVPLLRGLPSNRAGAL